MAYPRKSAMLSLAPGDIVFAPFPFEEDATVFKNRPCLVLAVRTDTYLPCGQAHDDSSRMLLGCTAPRRNLGGIVGKHSQGLLDQPQSAGMDRSELLYVQAGDPESGNLRVHSSENVRLGITVFLSLDKSIKQSALASGICEAKVFHGILKNLRT